MSGSGHSSVASRVAVRAYAKINLALSVGPRQPGGLHVLASWMHAIALWDEVRVESGGRLSSSGRAGGHDQDELTATQVRWADDAPCPGPLAWSADQDLCLRAHRALEADLARSLPARIRVLKRVPVGSGLGGGSSDAAATLYALCDLFGLNVSADRLAHVAAQVGSDVPFFVDRDPPRPADAPPRPALVGGTGQVMERVPPLDASVILIVPSFPCSTQAVYEAFDRGKGTHLRAGEVRRLALAGGLDPSALFNDLEPAAMEVQPALRDLARRARRAAGRPVHLTGSGSTLFVLCSHGEVRQVETVLRHALPDVALVPTRLV